jgi:hypothetical protein
MGDGIPSTAQVRELVVKVVRELGQPALAVAFSHQRPSAPVSPAEDLQTQTLRTVFGPDICAAHQAGLLTIRGLNAPHQFAGCVLGPPSAAGFAETLEAAREIAGEVVALDSPEYHLAELGASDSSSVAAFVHQLTLGIRRTGLRLIVNLNHAHPPTWATELAPGPLFATQRPVVSARELAAIRMELLRQLLTVDVRLPLRIDWHLGASDFAPEAMGVLEPVAGLALSYTRLAFTFDRPRQPVHLAEGLTRADPTVLLTVELNLPRLLQQPGAGDGTEQFLTKLGTLARLALSAAKQKREHLRRRAESHPLLNEGLRLERARLVVVPVGLENALRALADGEPSEMVKQVLKQLRGVLAQGGQPLRLAAVVDGWAACSEDHRDQVPPGTQFRFAKEGGTLALDLGEGASRTEAISWLQRGWEERIVRMWFR